VIDRRTGVPAGTSYGIGFALALPEEWNGRFLMQGGGGLNGSVQNPLGTSAAGDRPALARGFAVVELTYPFHDATFTVTHCGRICFHGRKVNLSHAFAGQNVGVTQVGERIWLVTFMQYDLGYFDDETCRLEPIENPFGAKLLPIRSE